VSTPLQLDLGFDLHPHAGTQLIRRRLRYPYVLTGTFRFDLAPSDMLTAIIQSASGAILAEDRLGQRIEVGPGAAAHITTQAATAVHWMPDDRCAQERVVIQVAAGGFAEYLPSPRILFPGSAIDQTLQLTVDRTATAIVVDGFTTHDPDRSGRAFRRCCGSVQIDRPDGQILAVDRFDVSGHSQLGGSMAGFTAHGMMVVVAPEGACDSDELAGVIEAAFTPFTGLYAATSELPERCGLGIRMSARNGSILRSATMAAWIAARTHLTGCPPGHRRI
jgi:urease accessory protein